MNSFISWLNEGKLRKEFIIIINDVEYKVTRTSHVITPRKGDNKPRDYKMSKEKYKNILSNSIDKIKDDKATTITWSNAGKTNAIVIQFVNNEFKIITAINNAETEVKKLLNKSPNTINLGEILFK